MQTLNFSCNWNNKLSCNVFTTLRASGRLTVGDHVLIHLKKKPLYTAEVIQKVRIEAGKISEGMAHVDTGYSKKETLEIIARMYKQKNVEDFPIYWYLLKAKRNPLRTDTPKSVQQTLSI